MNNKRSNKSRIILIIGALALILIVLGDKLNLSIVLVDILSIFWAITFSLSTYVDRKRLPKAFRVFSYIISILIIILTII